MEATAVRQRPEESSSVVRSGVYDFVLSARPLDRDTYRYFPLLHGGGRRPPGVKITVDNRGRRDGGRACADLR